jgi:sec-independent protein translocase protein TatA
MAFLPGHWEWLIILIAILLLFGAKRIPEIAHGVGKAITEFKRGAQSSVDEVKKEIERPVDDNKDEKS